MADPSGYTPRVAIITGSAKGLGYSIAHRFADDGIDVVINDLSSEADKIDEVVEEIKRKGRRAIGIVGNVSVEEDVVALVNKTIEELGSLDIMVANAGIAPHAQLVDTSVNQLDALYSVNIRGVFLCYKYAAQQMIKQGKGGRLIGASSGAGKQGISNLSAYCATKFAVRGLTQTAAVELQKYGITANTYAPGFVPTTLIIPFSEGIEGDSREVTNVKFGLPPNTPFGTPESVASIVSYLVKPEAFFISGQTLSVDGGMSVS